MATANISAQRLRELLTYDPQTGLFTRLVNRAKFRAGEVAGTAHGKGYIALRIAGFPYKAHRLAWFYVYGIWPAGEIDHINGNRSDNRIENLRDVTKHINQQNQRKARRDNKSSGLLGAHWNKRGQAWTSAIDVGGKQRHLGRFATAQEAHEAYIAAKRTLHAGCTL